MQYRYNLICRIVDKIVIKMGDEMLAMKNSLLSVMEIFIKRLASHQVNKGFDQRKKNYRVKSENIVSIE